MANGENNMAWFVKRFCILVFLSNIAFGALGDYKIAGDFHLTGDEKKIYWYEGSNYLTFRAPSTLAANYNFTWPTDDGTGGQALITDGSGVLTWTEPSTSFTHNLLSPTHLDTTTQSPTRGSLIYGNSTPAWDEKTIGAVGTIFRSDGTDCDWAATTLITALGTIATGTWQATDVGVQYGGTGVSTLTDGGLLLGSGTGAITAMGVLADGTIVIGDGTTDPTGLAAFTGAAGTLKHESGGLEANVSGYTDGLYGMASGATIDIDTIAEIETAIGGSTNILTESEIDASSELLAIMDDETGSGAGSPLLVFNQAPTIDSPTFTTAITATDLLTNTHFTHSTDWGDVKTDASGNVILDDDTIAVAEFLASQDWGDVSTAADGTVSLDNDVVSTAEMADADHGDISWNSGTATIDADTVTEADLKAVDAASDEDILTYEATTGDFEWHTIAQMLALTDTDSLSEGATNLYQLTQEEVEDYIGGLINDAESDQTLITVTYDDTNDAVDFVVDSDLHNYSWTNVDATDLKTGSVTQAFGAILDDLNTLGANAADSEFLVGTAAGALAWESGATVRTSLGLGLNDNVGFGIGALTVRDVILDGGVDSDFYIKDGATTWMNIYPDAADNGDMCIDVPVKDLDFDVAGIVRILAGSGISLYPGGDTDDYLEISTVADQSRLNFVGQDGIILSSGGHTTIDGVDVSTKSAEFDTHKASNGSDHSYIDQDVTVSALPTFAGLTQVGDATNKMTVAADGEINLHGTAKVKKFFLMRYDFTKTASAEETTRVFSSTVALSPTTDERIAFNGMIPLDWDGGNLVVKFWWSPRVANSSGSSKYPQWQGFYQLLTAGESWNTYTSVTSFQGEEIPDAEAAETIHDETFVTITSGATAGDIIIIAVQRDADHVGDTYASDVCVSTMAWVEYTADKLGEAT